MYKFTVTKYETGTTNPAIETIFENDQLFWGFGLVKSVIKLPTCLMPGSRYNDIVYIDFAESARGSKGSKFNYSLGIEKVDGSKFSQDDLIDVKTYVAQVRFEYKAA